MLPAEFTQRMKSRLGEQYSEFEDALTKPAPVSVRLNPKKSGPWVAGEDVPWSSMGRYLATRPVFTLDPALHAGAYYVQEASSMFLEFAIRQHASTGPLVALDLCAAPGGKSTHLLSLLHSESLLISNEVIRTRASVLAENICKWGYPNAIITQNDPHDFVALTGFFDLVVVDAPCSGEGLFRKDAHAASEWSEEHVELCSLRQRRILADVWPSLKEDGLLIYCTCTYSEAENEQTLLWLKHEQQLEFLTLKPPPEWGVEEVYSQGAVGYRFYPHRARGEGFFLAVMRKKSPAEPVRIRGRQSTALASANIRSRLDSWMQQPEKLVVHQRDDLLIALPAGWPTSIDLILAQLNVITRGTALASIKHDKLVAEHAWALSTELRRGTFDECEVDEATALAFLRKENIHLPSNQKGMALVTHRQLPLGWINRLGNRTNNLYPANWRIRMK